MTTPGPVTEHHPLHRRTTLRVGGPARYLAEAPTPAAVRAWLEFAADRALPVALLGGGSNLLVSDAGFPGLVLQPGDDHIQAEPDGPDHVRVHLGAALTWDDAVAWAVRGDLAGLECLSGIPGHVGAAPIQNIGAYGQEVGDVLVAVEAIDRHTGDLHRLTRAECDLAYRWSAFKGPWRGRWIVVGVELRLERGGAPTLRYGDLTRRFEGRDRPPTLREVRDAVLEVRRSKSMVLDDADPNTRSAGSFFVNPILPAEALPEVLERVAAHVGPDAELPRWPTDDGRVKLPAAWLIERAGFARGFEHGRAGLSSRHCLALINRTGDCAAAELIDLARLIRRGVRDTFGVALSPEPRLLGFPPEVAEGLGGHPA